MDVPTAIEPLTSREQGPARCDAAVAVFHDLPPEARLSIRPRQPLLPLTYARPVGRKTPQTISFRANALNSRGIVGAGNPGRFAATSWWWTQSSETGLPGAISLSTGKNREISLNLVVIARANHNTSAVS
jgi:hypothetical protein